MSVGASGKGLHVLDFETTIGHFSRRFEHFRSRFCPAHRLQRYQAVTGSQQRSLSRRRHIARKRMAYWDVARISQRRFATWNLVVQTPAARLYDGSRGNVAARRLKVEAGERDDRDAKAHGKAEPERNADAQPGERPRAGGYGHRSQRLAFDHGLELRSYRLLAAVGVLGDDAD